MKRVAVIRKKFLPLTETFIYEELRKLKRYKGYVFTRSRANKKKFPYARVIVVPKKKSWGSYLKKYKIDLIHARFGPAGIEMLNTKRRLGLPMITSFHGTDNPRNRKNRKKYKHLKKLFRQGNKFTVTNKQMGNILREYGCQSHKIRVQHSGIDLKKFPFKVRKRPRKKPIQILFVGRLVEKKGANYLIEAFKQVVKKEPNVRLTMIGDGEQRKKLKKLIKRLGLKRKVRLLSARSHPEVIKYMGKSHLFCLPSVTGKNRDQEGIPNVLKEAMACGIPVISTKHAGIPELINHKKTGYLVKERDTKALAKTLLFAIRHPNRWAKIGREARRKIEKDFDSRKQTAQLEKLYDHVLKNHKKKKKRRGKR